METVRHSSPLGTWEQIRHRPGPPLRGLAGELVGWTERTPGPLRRRELPSDHVTLILGWDEPLRVELDGVLRAACPAFLAALHDGPAITEHAGSSSGVEVRLTPPAARMLFGVPLHELSRDVVALDALLGRTGDQLVARLADAVTWEERFAVVERFLAARLAGAPAPPPDALHAWSVLRDSAGRARVGEVAQRVGCSRRHLSARFGDWIGLPPKAAARVLRFQSALQRLRAGEEPARVAAGCGYADQPHLNRDFRDLAGVAPRALLATRLPDNGGYRNDGV